MNWVGGARKRVKIQGEKKLQRDFFERKKLESKPLKKARGHVGSKSISQDLLALQTVSNIKYTPQDEPKFVRKIDLDKFRSVVCRPTDVEIPSSPNDFETPSIIHLYEKGCFEPGSGRVSQSSKEVFDPDQHSSFQHRSNERKRRETYQPSSQHALQSHMAESSDSRLQSIFSKPSSSKTKYQDLNNDDVPIQKSVSFNHPNKAHKPRRTSKIPFDPWAVEDFQATPLPKYESCDEGYYRNKKWSTSGDAGYCTDMDRFHKSSSELYFNKSKDSSYNESFSMDNFERSLDNNDSNSKYHTPTAKDMFEGDIENRFRMSKSKFSERKSNKHDENRFTVHSNEKYPVRLNKSFPDNLPDLSQERNNHFTQCNGQGDNIEKSLSVKSFDTLNKTHPYLSQYKSKKSVSRENLPKQALGIKFPDSTSPNETFLLSKPRDQKQNKFVSSYENEENIHLPVTFEADIGKKDDKNMFGVSFIETTANRLDTSDPCWTRGGSVHGGTPHKEQDYGDFFSENPSIRFNNTFPHSHTNSANSRGTTPCKKEVNCNKYMYLYEYSPKTLNKSFQMLPDFGNQSDQLRTSTPKLNGVESPWKQKGQKTESTITESYDDDNKPDLRVLPQKELNPLWNKQFDRETVEKDSPCEVSSKQQDPLVLTHRDPCSTIKSVESSSSGTSHVRCPNHTGDYSDLDSEEICLQETPQRHSANNSARLTSSFDEILDEMTQLESESDKITMDEKKNTNTCKDQNVEKITITPKSSNEESTDDEHHDTVSQVVQDLVHQVAMLKSSQVSECDTQFFVIPSRPITAAPWKVSKGTQSQNKPIPGNRIDTQTYEPTDGSRAKGPQDSPATEFPITIKKEPLEYVCIPLENNVSSHHENASLTDSCSIGPISDVSTSNWNKLNLESPIVGFLTSEFRGHLSKPQEFTDFAPKLSTSVQLTSSSHCVSQTSQMKDVSNFENNSQNSRTVMSQTNVDDSLRKEIQSEAPTIHNMGPKKMCDNSTQTESRSMLDACVSPIVLEPLLNVSRLVDAGTQCVIWENNSGLDSQMSLDQESQEMMDTLPANVGSTDSRWLIQDEQLYPHRDSESRAKYSLRSKKRMVAHTFII